MRFDYSQQLQYTADIEIEDVGNVCIKGIDQTLSEYYLVVKTDDGITQVVEYGPRYIDLQISPNKVWYDYYKFEYSDRKVNKVIDNFLNNTKYCIFQAEEVPIDYIKEMIFPQIDWIAKEG